MLLSDLAPAIFASLGVADLPLNENIGISPSGRECLLLIDGLGRDSLATYAQYAPHISAMVACREIETAFPSTTATSLTTLTTGELPGVHGMLGYTVRVPRSGGRILNALKWDERVDPMNWQPVATLFERAAAVGISVSHVAAKRYEDSGFTRASFRGARYLGANVVAEMIENARLALKTSPAFAYLYVNELDVAGHSDGVGSEKWLRALTHVDSVVERLRADLPRGTRFWLTSDHGMINVSEKIVIGKSNPLLTGVATIAGEPRARHIYLDEHHLEGNAPTELAQMWREFLGDRGEVATKMEAEIRQLFGPKISLDARDRMGDLIVICKDETILIDPARENLESMMVGHHGAQTESERFVPLRMEEIGK